MRLYGLLQNINQLVLTLSLVGAAFLNPTAEGQVAGRLMYSVITLALAIWLYQRTRLRHEVAYPTIPALLRRTLSVSYRPYWRFGLENALDKNIANLYTYLPLQLVGILSGPTAASYIQLALRGINRTSFFTSAVFENMQAVIPLAIGRGDYRRLWRNFMRVQGVVTLGSVAFYALVIVLAPLLLVPIFGEEWVPVLPLLPAFTLYGILTNVGGNFGPLYRALDLMRPAIVSKIVALVVMLPAGFWLIGQLDALGGVWMINGLLALPIVIIAAVTLPILRQQARATHV
jgi:O-antigen/teichoic acid export membrane protein